MKKSHLLTLFVAVLAIVFGAASAQAAKVEICHIPPGNLGNWHTISVSENALQAHLNHGDLEGSCPANCPCWTEAELDLIADGSTDVCFSDPMTLSAISGTNVGGGPNDIEDAGSVPDGEESYCYYFSLGPPDTYREITIPLPVENACATSIQEECSDRGF